MKLLANTPGFSPLPKPETILYYIYAVLSSNTYRDNYADGLKIDFPRIPFTHDFPLFSEFARLGEQLANLHLMKSPKLDITYSKFAVEGDNYIERILHEPYSMRLFINDRQYFSNIDTPTWEFKMGGYQILHKWLKDRRGTHLDGLDILHVIKIIRSLQCTRRYQQKIDKLFPGIEETLLLQYKQ